MFNRCVLDGLSEWLRSQPVSILTRMEPRANMSDGTIDDNCASDSTRAHPRSAIFKCLFEGAQFFGGKKMCSTRRR